MPSQLLAPLFGSTAMEAVWSDEAAVVAMVAFETALAAAEAEVGIVPRRPPLPPSRPPIQARWMSRRLPRPRASPATPPFRW